MEWKVIASAPLEGYPIQIVAKGKELGYFLQIARKNEMVHGTRHISACLCEIDQTLSIETIEGNAGILAGFSDDADTNIATCRRLGKAYDALKAASLLTAEEIWRKPRTM